MVSPLNCDSAASISEGRKLFSRGVKKLSSLPLLSALGVGGYEFDSEVSSVFKLVIELLNSGLLRCSLSSTWSSSISPTLVD